VSVGVWVGVGGCGGLFTLFSKSFTTADQNISELYLATVTVQRRSKGESNVERRESFWKDGG